MPEGIVGLVLSQSRSYPRFHEDKFLCFPGQYQDGLNRILSVHVQNGYGFIPGHGQETSGNFGGEDTGRVP